MSYIVVVPEAIKDRIRSWELSFEAEDKLYETLENELKDGPEGKCSRIVMGPLVCAIAFQDPILLGVSHYCNFWVTLCANEVHVLNCFHKEEECWDPESDDRPDYDNLLGE